MSEQEKIQLFEDQKIRTAWDTEKEEWYFSVTDVISVLTGQQTARGASNYWAKLKQRLKEEGADELLTNCQQLKMTASDGKRRATDVATTEQLLRIIQSVPSPRAEPVKRWLAEVGRERIEETIDPEQAISQTEEKLRKDQVSTSDAATAVHYAVGNEVREAIRKIDGTMPEDLPTPEKSIAQLEREQMERLKQKAIDGQLMLDE